MFDASAFDPFDTVQEWFDVRRSEPSALLVRAHLLLGQKNAETSDMKLKCRMVAGGNNVVDTGGLPFFDEAMYGAPASLEIIRFVVWWSTMSPCFVLWQSDVRHAYLQASLKGPPVYLVLPTHVRPASWSNMHLPVLRLRRAIYGLKRSGFDWMEHASRVLRHHGWIDHPDHADSLFTKGSGKSMLLLAVYVDDFLAAGDEKLLRAEFKAFMA
jgi:hypothetical protein